MYLDFHVLRSYPDEEVYHEENVEGQINLLGRVSVPRNAFFHTLTRKGEKKHKSPRKSTLLLESKVEKSQLQMCQFTQLFKCKEFIALNALKSFFISSANFLHFICEFSATLIQIFCILIADFLHFLSTTLRLHFYKSLNFQSWAKLKKFYFLQPYISRYLIPFISFWLRFFRQIKRYECIPWCVDKVDDQRCNG